MCIYLERVRNRQLEALRPDVCVGERRGSKTVPVERWCVTCLCGRVLTERWEGGPRDGVRGSDTLYLNVTGVCRGGVP